MPGYGAKYWEERTPSSKRKKYPACRGELSADVVVIGGGLTGAMAAAVLARGGLDVILLESARVASAGTATGLGAVVPFPASSFRELVSAAGQRLAAASWKETRSSALDLLSSVTRLGIRCDAARTPVIQNATSAEAATLLRRDQAARKAARIDAPWVSQTAMAQTVATESTGALRLDGGATFDPVLATLGFLRVAERAGARVFERSPAKRTTFDRVSAEVRLADGVIRTKGVFVATGTPGSLFAQLRRHVREFDAFTVVTEPLTAAMRREAGSRTDILCTFGEEDRWLRWLKDDRAMFSGAAAGPVPPRLLDKMLVQRTGQLMYELSLRYPVISGLPAHWSWSTRLTTTADGLPWIGPHRNYPFHFFAMALGQQGEAGAWFAAKAALRHFTGQSRKTDQVFGFLR